MIKNLSPFMRQIIRNPTDVGAVAPSGRALGQHMASKIDPTNGPVVEIGPGTGAITRHILAAGIAASDLALFEMNPHFCARLEQRFPEIRVHNRMAQEMGDLGFNNLGAVVSSLPLLNMPTQVQRAITDCIFSALKPGAPMIQFTYGAKPPLAPEIRSELGLEWSKSPRIWLNLPPATVYMFRQTRTL